MAVNTPINETKVRPQGTDADRQAKSINIAIFIVKVTQGIDGDHKGLAAVLESMRNDLRSFGILNIEWCGQGDVSTDIETARRNIYESKISDKNLTKLNSTVKSYITVSRLNRYKDNATKKKPTPSPVQLLIAARADRATKHNRTNF